MTLPNLPFAWPGSGGFHNITIDHATCPERPDRRIIAADCHFCGAGQQGAYLVSRTSVLSKHTYTDHACSRCVQTWFPAQQDRASSN